MKGGAAVRAGRRAPRRSVWLLAVVLGLAFAAEPGAGGVAARRATLRAAQAAALAGALDSLRGVDWSTTGFALPVQGRVSSYFGWRNVSVNGNRYHGGLDIAAPSGTPVKAARSGVVTRSGWWGTYGNVVVLDHGDGSETRYAHLSAVAVRVGQALRQGDVLGAVGSTGASTGPHLHFEVRFDGRAVDPLPYLQGRL
ncbi:MAG: M23 family metallopeptidase [Trueperaceae bacterium]|nr:M23 family metallopeptidase [Trueperaceae bacterium]